MTKRPVKIANFSGALGDWVGAFSAAVRGEPVDVLTGDYLAEVTMARVASNFLARGEPAAIRRYYADIFLLQLTPELETIAKRGIKIVVNAGAFNPAGLAEAIRAEIAARDLPLRVAYTRGDDLFPQLHELVAEVQLLNLDTGLPLGDLAERIVAANAYMGGWGIVSALGLGADIVICGRVSDASLAVGPAAWWHGWKRDDWDRLAGAVAAGHIIECGPQATGGNFSGFAELGMPTRIGYPIAEIAEDGSSVITKRAEEGGAVTIDTVTAQLMYEIQGADYLNPDVVLKVDSVQLAQEAPDRVRLSGVRGAPAPVTTKLGCFYPNGWKTSFWVFATGIGVDQKVGWLERQMRSVVDGLALDEYHFDVLGRAAENPTTKPEATVAIRIAASSAQQIEVQKLLGGLGSFGMGSLPGLHAEASGATDIRVDYWPALVRQDAVRQQVVLDDGRVIDIEAPPMELFRRSGHEVHKGQPVKLSGETRQVPLAQIIHTRSGDKGANASLGVWTRRPEAWDWLCATLTPSALARLLDLNQGVAVERHDLPNLHGVLFVLNGYFGVSGSGSVGLDPLGKAIGEFLSARLIDIPIEFLEPSPITA